MASDSFNTLGGYTVGIPPVVVIDSNGNITSNNANIGNLVASIITSSGNVTAPYFIGNVVGNVSGNFVVPGTNTAVLFNNQGNAGASDAFRFNSTTNVVSVTGNISVTNILTDNYRYANGAPYVFAATAAGSNTQIQFNSNGVLGASSTFTFDSANNIFAAENVSSITVTSTEINADDIVTSNSVTATTFIGNLVGNISGGNVVSANYLTGVLTTNAQPNITSVGTLSNLSVTGNTTTNILVSNTVYGTLATQAQPNITSVGTLTSLAVTGNVSAGNINGGNLVSANYLTGTLTTASQSNITRVGTLGFLNIDGNVGPANGNITLTGSINGTGVNSRISVAGNITAGNVSATLLTGTLTTNDQPNIWSVGNLTSLTVQGPVDLGAVGNITITGGSPNYVLSTDGAGSLSWVEQTGGGGGNGTPGGSNTQVQYNLNGNFAGSGSFTYNDTTNTLIVGGNINATTAIRSPQLISNVATGTAPFVVTSTTQVANLSVATANTATFANTATNANVALTVSNAAQPNITSVGNLTQLDVGGNLQVFGKANVVGNISVGNFDTTGTIISSTATVTGNSTFGGTLQVSGGGQLKVLGTVNTASSSNVFLGNVENIHISGGTNGYLLATDGAGNLSWSAGGGGGGNGTPGGSNTQIQYNDTGAFGGSAYLTFNEATNTFQIAGNLIANTTQMGAGIYKFSTSSVFFATTTSSSPDQLLWDVPVANISGVDFTIIATDVSANSRQTSKISSTVLGNTVVYTEYAGLQINGGVGSFSMEYSPGNIIANPTVRLLISPDSANLIRYNMMITEYAAV